MKVLSFILGLLSSSVQAPSSFVKPSKIEEITFNIDSLILDKEFGCDKAGNSNKIIQLKAELLEMGVIHKYELR